MADFCARRKFHMRDAIHPDDLARLDVYMDKIQDEHFLHAELEDKFVRIDIYEYPSNRLVMSDSFAASDLAPQVFAEDKEMDEEFLQSGAENPYDDSADSEDCPSDKGNGDSCRDGTDDKKDADEVSGPREA